MYSILLTYSIIIRYDLFLLYFRIVVFFSWSSNQSPRALHRERREIELWLDLLESFTCSIIVNFRGERTDGREKERRWNIYKTWAEVWRFCHLQFEMHKRWNGCLSSFPFIPFLLFNELIVEHTLKIILSENQVLIWWEPDFNMMTNAMSSYERLQT